LCLQYELNSSFFAERAGYKVPVVINTRGVPGLETILEKAIDYNDQILEVLFLSFSIDVLDIFH